MSERFDFTADGGGFGLSPQQLARVSGVLPETVMRYWRVGMLHSDDELKRSYALRCRVYCEERGFLPLADYPEGVETDKFDDHSIHFGSYDSEGEMVGSARLVLRGPWSFPMFDHCVIEPRWQREIESIPKLVEISRLVVSRRYRRRLNDGYYGIQQLGDARPIHSRADERRAQFSVAVSLFKAMYQAGRRLGITHALSAMELTLRRLLQHYHFPFEKIGPECDYFGPVTPFILDVAATERAIAANSPDLYEEFNRGLDASEATPLIA